MDKLKYWRVRVSKAISYKNIMVTADTVEIIDGNLIFKRDDGLIVFCVANTDWLCFYAACCKDSCGSPISVENWAPVERNGDYER